MQPKEPSKLGVVSSLNDTIKPLSELISAVTVVIGLFGLHFVVPQAAAPYAIMAAVALTSYLALTRRLDALSPQLSRHRTLVKATAIVGLSVSILGMITPAAALVYLRTSPVYERQAWAAYDESVGPLPGPYTAPTRDLPRIDTGVDHAVSRLAAQVGLVDRTASQVRTDLTRALPTGYVGDLTELRTRSHIVRIYRILRSPQKRTCGFYPGVRECFYPHYPNYTAVAFAISAYATSPLALTHWKPAVAIRQAREASDVPDITPDEQWFMTARAYEGSHSVSVALFGNSCTFGGNYCRYWIETVRLPDFGEVTRDPPFPFQHTNIIRVFPRDDGFDAEYQSSAADPILGTCSTCGLATRTVSVGWDASTGAFRILSDHWQAGTPRMLLYELKLALRHESPDYNLGVRFFTDPGDTATMRNVVDDMRSGCRLDVMWTPDTAKLSCKVPTKGLPLWRTDMIKFQLQPDRSWRIISIARGKPE